jgi:acyl-CoA thioester hydrolase
LRAEAPRRIRFEETDPLGIVWHGRYPSFFEDARMALGEKFQVDYLTFYTSGVVTPIKRMHIDYILPLRFQDEVVIEGIHHWSDAARINIEYIIRNAQGETATRGYTVQMMLDVQGSILLVPPDFYLEFSRRWQAGELA